MMSNHKTVHTATKSFIASIFGSPERDRLAGAIAKTKADLDQQNVGGGAAAKHGWHANAQNFLQAAETNLRQWKIQQGWVSLMAAQREILKNPNNLARIQRVAIVLRQELEKITGWRAKGIADLICGPNGELLDGFKDAKKITSEMHDRVVDAIELRDDQFSTTYFKILLRRRNLIQLLLLLWFGIGVGIVLSVVGVLPAPYHDWKMVVAVVLFGVLGAALSVSLGLLSADLSAKIPAQQLGSFVVWMRPAIGAAAALVAYALIHANITLKVFNWQSTDFAVIAIISVAAGFSERFIVGAIEKISDTKK